MSGKVTQHKSCYYCIRDAFRSKKKNLIYEGKTKLHSVQVKVVILVATLFADELL